MILGILMMLALGIFVLLVGTFAVFVIIGTKLFWVTIAVLTIWFVVKMYNEYGRSRPGV